MILAHALGYSIAVRRLDLARLGACLRELPALKIAELCVEIFDGAFAPGFALGYETIEMLRRESPLPCHAWLSVERPERYLDDLARLGCAAVTVPIETCLHAHRTIARIRDLGMAPGLSIQPGTALTKLEYVLPMVDHLVLPVRDSDGGVAPVSPAAYDRVRILRENLDYHRARATLHVSGELSATEAARLAALGATRVLLDRRDVVGVEPLAATVQAFMDEAARARRTA